MKYMTPVVIAMLALSISACATKRVAVLDPNFVIKPAQFKVIDQRPPEIADSYFTKSGNIYSCQYGISLVENDQVVPERLEYLVHVLNRNSPDWLAGKTIKVDRFTIYRNAHVETRRVAISGMLGGAIGGAIAGAADKASDGMPLASVDWNTAGNSLVENAKLGSVVGCEEAYSGSYWESELKEGAAPFVLYFDASLNGVPYKLRMVQPTTQSFLDDTHFAEQLRLSIDRVAQEFLRYITLK